MFDISDTGDIILVDMTLLNGSTVHMVAVATDNGIPPRQVPTSNKDMPKPSLRGRASLLKFNSIVLRCAELHLILLAVLTKARKFAAFYFYFWPI
jgi:hypothetical protein